MSQIRTSFILRTSKVQTIRNSFFLAEHHFLSRFPEVSVNDLHSAFAKSKQPSFSAHGFDDQTPDISSFAMTNSSWFASSASVFFCVRISKIRFLVFTSGMGNSILWSMRPGRMRAGSSASMRFVAMITLTSPRVSNHLSLLNSSSFVR